MKILHVINALRIGGAEKLLVDMLPLFSEKEDVALFLLKNNDSPFKSELIHSNVQIIGNNGRRRISFKNIKLLIHVAKACDIIHIHLFPAQYFILFLKLIFPEKIYITTEHNTHNQRRDFLIFKVIEKVVYGLFDNIICISEPTRDNLLVWQNPKKVGKYLTIHNGINVATFRNAIPANKENFFSKESFLICMVGSLTRQKDQSTIIKALFNLPENIKLLLAGDGDQRQYLEKLVEENSLKQRVLFLGNRSDIPEILKMVDVSVVSSNWEGFGLVAVEGMAAGRPVVASNVEGLRDVVEGAGLLFEKGNAKDLALMVTRLYEDKNLYEEVQLKCIRRAEDFRIESMADKYLELYKLCLHKKSN